MYKIGFLGLGKMGTSLLMGMLNKNLYPKEDICFYAPSDKTKAKGRSFGINLAANEADLLEKSQIIILAVEPQKYEQIFALLGEIDTKNKTIISLAPGKNITYLKGVFKEAQIVRAMPNTPSLIGEGVTTLAFEGETIKEVIDIFSSVGTCVVIKEEEIDKAIPLQGSMPAYIFEFVKSFVDVAKKYDLDEKDATKLALLSIIGSCELALKSEKDLDELIDSVCSPGGATIAGLDALRANNFEESIKECYRACVRHSEELKK